MASPRSFAPTRRSSASICGASWRSPEAPAETIAAVERLVAERIEARKRKDWAASDTLRDELATLGVAVKDGKAGSTWEFAR